MFAEGKYTDAEITYRKAVQQSPQLGEAHYRLGLVERKLGNAVDAYRELSRAMDLMPDRDDIKVELGDVAFGLYVNDSRHPRVLYDQLEKLSQQLLAKNPNSYDGLMLKGFVAITDGKANEAEELLRRANAVKPMEPKIILPLVELLFNQNRYPEGENLAEELIQARKDFGPMYDVLYTHYQRQKELAEGERVLKAKVANNPKAANARLQLAQHFYRSQNRAEMQRTLDGILDHPKDFPDRRLDLGDFYATIGDRDNSLRQFRAGLAEKPKEKANYLKKIASVLIAQGKPDEAIKTLDEVLKENPRDTESMSVRARLFLETRNAGKLDTALADLRSLAKDRPYDLVLLYSLGRAEMEKGNLDAARKQFLDVLKLRYGFMPAHTALVQISEKKQDYKEMLQQADQILQLDPGNSNARLWRGVALMGTRNYDQARSELTELVRSHPQFEDAELQLGLLDVDQNRLADAEAIFRKLYKPGQPDGRPLEGLVRTLTARKEPDKALPILAEALKKSPDSKAVRSQLAFVAATTGNTDLAIDQYTWLVEKDPGNIDHQVRLAEAYRAKGDFTSAAAAFQTAWKLAPKDIRIPTALASIQDANGQREQAKATYLEALKLDPDNPFILNNLAFMLADTNGNLEEAMGMLERAQRKQPNDPRISDTVGWVYLKKNLTDSAIQIFSSLVHKSPDDPNYRYHLALALLQKGDKARAREEFEIALEHHPGKDTADRIKQLIGKM